jgi:sugar phosphate isomerase/epimerase
MHDSSQKMNTNILRLGAPLTLSTPLLTRNVIWSGSVADDPGELARAHRRLGFRAAYCPQVELTDKERIASIVRAYQAEDVVIAEVQAFSNTRSSDPDERKRSLDFSCNQLALADELGARCCVNTAGWIGNDPKNRIHADNLSQTGFEQIVETTRYIVDLVKPKRAKYTLETMPWIMPDGPDIYVDLIRAVDRPGFAAHFDPTNMINSPRRYIENAKFLEECFAKLGPWIVSCHVKDIRLTGEFNVHLAESPVGAGVLDYRTYLRGVASLPQNPTLMLEHLDTAEEYVVARDHLRVVAKDAGVSFLGA